MRAVSAVLRLAVGALALSSCGVLWDAPSPTSTFLDRDKPAHTTSD